MAPSGALPSAASGFAVLVEEAELRAVVPGYPEGRARVAVLVHQQDVLRADGVVLRVDAPAADKDLPRQPADKRGHDRRADHAGILHSSHHESTSSRAFTCAG